MRVLGIDPGITRCGVGVVDIDVSRVASLVYVAVIRSEPNLATQFRLLKISEGIAATITRFSPEIVALERPFAKENRQSVTTTMQAMGVAMAEAGRAGLPVALHTPSEVKAAVSGNGAATKAQVEAMIARILRLDKPPKPADAADALAVAITHAWRGTGILGSGIDGDVSVSLSGGVKTRVGTKLTAAQQIWAQAEAQSRRSGAVRRHSR
ncbi:crossover junction endodeoxyribonuclease RuvC [Mobiluncus mulieris]|uniref:Crossover junction endodeoxyribonuclease RuvC n=2 Tax=Mobiluncus mulieris TaxID=2052 RepID=E0QRP2_9ACTO|nr:crossover junction endodeoxyribonuclease RuvC [Mobiluncus mulieris]EEJ54171.1 crossover junction endodeoxyribonuclease RuvC [Mobiluncus mulieris ATCC 35243]EEZ91163.1 crossover junction endodeoxyribonuclease RuvC [Mobiluncus mulieris 28-1]EFM45750.1 crossover junction endodeoxyribonuclease RuvC [Mobiluncus mulieris ATCC 35239]EFN92971.1 crossover junction endodeoxyribonuclease RuvC [Mobiluncus mulieris FB024-16]MBB5846071.1 crossover junction endodeoxyribonuclease RuvC [Mobiluncus mulieris]